MKRLAVLAALGLSLFGTGAANAQSMSLTSTGRHHRQRADIQGLWLHRQQRFSGAELERGAGRRQELRRYHV